MFSVPLLVSLVAIGVAGWAVLVARLTTAAFRAARAELLANRLALAAAVQQAADEQAGKETALRLLDEVTVLRTEDLREATARLKTLQQKYEITLRLYRDSIAIDGPLASRRLQ